MVWPRASRGGSGRTRPADCESSSFRRLLLEGAGACLPGLERTSRRTHRRCGFGRPSSSYASLVGSAYLLVCPLSSSSRWPRPAAPTPAATPLAPPRAPAELELPPAVAAVDNAGRAAWPQHGGYHYRCTLDRCRFRCLRQLGRQRPARWCCRVGSPPTNPPPAGTIRICPVWTCSEHHVHIGRSS